MIFGFEGRRAGPRALLCRACVETGHGALDLILITGAAGIVIGVLAISGLGFQLTLGLVQIGQGHLFVLLLLSAIVCIVLGMGLPTVGVYVLLATLVAPSLVEVGVKPIAAHLYVMYFGMMSMITPPIAIAAFAAASVAKADADAHRLRGDALRLDRVHRAGPVRLFAEPAADRRAGRDRHRRHHRHARRLAGVLRERRLSSCGRSSRPGACCSPPPAWRR